MVLTMPDGEATRIEAGGRGVGLEGFGYMEQQQLLRFGEKKSRLVSRSRVSYCLERYAI